MGAPITRLLGLGLFSSFSSVLLFQSLQTVKVTWLDLGWNGKEVAVLCRGTRWEKRRMHDGGGTQSEWGEGMGGVGQSEPGWDGSGTSPGKRSDGACCHATNAGGRV